MMQRNDGKGIRWAAAAAESGPRSREMQQQNRIPVREIRTLASKVPLPLEDFDDAP